MSTLDAVLAYKAKKDAEAAADVMAIPSAINAYTTSRQKAQDNLLQNLVTQATLAKTGYEIQDLASKDEARKNLPKILEQFGMGGQGGKFGFTGATVDPMTGELKYTIGETSEAKSARELKEKEAEINLKSKVPTAQQKADIAEARNAESLLSEMKKDAEKLPDSWAAIGSNMTNFFTRGKFNPKLVTYNDSRPAVAVGLYRTLTGDKRLSDSDAKSRALPLMWDSDEDRSVREEKFSKLGRMAKARLRLVERGDYTVDAQGQFITPLEAVEAEAEKVDATGAGVLPEGVTEDDIEYTMKKHKLTREQVLEKLNA